MGFHNLADMSRYKGAQSEKKIKKEIYRDCTNPDSNGNYPSIPLINKYSAKHLHIEHHVTSK
jgi:hypothetical protein